jgi:hypothetical protein
MAMRNKHIVIGIVLLAIVSTVFLLSKVQDNQAIRDAEKLLEKPLPPFTELSENLVLEPKDEVNLPVPFTSQAPHANWDMPYQEACEEAAALMAIRYIFNNPIDNPEDADAAILDLVRDNETLLNNPVDQTVVQVIDLIQEVDPGISAYPLSKPTVEEIQIQLSQGNVVIVPAAGKKLMNPFYKNGGPLYHMLVLRGYTADGYFITNDPGTKRGEGYLYPFEVIMEAMGDWNDGDPRNGEKVVLILEPQESVLDTY